LARLILASASPRRKLLLEQAGYNFEIIESCIDETIVGTAGFCVETLALRKAKAVAEKVGDNAIIIAADTLVSIDGRVLEKPKDHAEAFDMLRLLSGNKHTVYTGVAIIATLGGGQSPALHFVESTDVFFRHLTDQEIHAYIATKEPFDKAGAYGIQGYGATLVHRIEGCFYSVMGLPIARLHVELSKIVDYKTNLLSAMGG